MSIQKSVYEKSFLSPFKGFDPAFATEWLKAIDQAKTLSKLHTLYGILENSISWEKSSESLVRRHVGYNASFLLLLYICSIVLILFIYIYNMSKFVYIAMDDNIVFIVPDSQA